MLEPKDKKPGAEAERGQPLTIPANATVSALARAMWGEIVLRPKGKMESAERAKLWQKDQKEYMMLARRIIGRLTRQLEQ